MDDVKKPSVESVEVPSKDAGAAGREQLPDSDFSELEELEKQVAKDDAEDKKSEAVKSGADSEVIKKIEDGAEKDSEEQDKEKNKKVEEQESSEKEVVQIDDVLAEELKDVIGDKSEPDRSKENIDAEIKRKVEQALKNAGSSAPVVKQPMSDEELEEMIAKDHPGLTVEQFKAFYKFNNDFYNQLVLPDLRKRETESTIEAKHKDEITKFRHYADLKDEIDNLLKTDETLKLLPPEHRYKRAYKDAVTKNLGKVLERRIKKAKMQASDKKKVLPKDAPARVKKIEKSELPIKLTGEDKAYMKRAGLTEKDLTNPLLEEGKTVIDIDE